MLRNTGIGILTFLIASSISSAGTSNSLMDIAPAGKSLVVCNNDNGTITLVDLVKKVAVREIKVGKKPEGVTWIGDGPRVAVTLYHESKIVIVNTATGKIEKSIPTPAEPYGIVTDAKGMHAWVSHEYPGVVSEIDLQAGNVVREIPAGSMPRGIAIAPDGKRVYVSEFYTGILHAIDLASGKTVDSWKGHSTDNLARQVLLHPSRPKAYLPHIRSMVKVNDGSGSIFPQVSICDLKPGKERRRTSFGMDTFNGIYVVTNPWEAAISPNGKRFYVIYAGTNDMNYCDVIDDDYKEIERVGNAVRIGQNPRAVRVSPDSKNVYIYHAMYFSVSIYNANMGFVKAIKTCEPTKTPEWVRGKILFNTANPPMSSRRWIACSSCHPDGGHDARVWQQAEGLRKTTAFVGMAHTHPLHWSADRDEVQDFEYTLRSRLMQSFGGLLKTKIKQKIGFHKVELEEKTSGRSKDLDALAIYSNSLDFPLSPHIVAPGKLTPAAERGKTLFFAKEVGCASCHSGPYYTDSSLKTPFKLHDVGTGRNDKSERMGTKYDTPTLLGVYRTAPFLHDGSALTLREVLTTQNKGDKHGKTSHLQKDQVDDLLQFLKSLPYETPPEVTGNTVEYRVQPTKKE
ncbi:MAG: hypothetical protein HYX68_10505 [Planctomycetes bacterium]|nr:hypothetical protein [Planctomycetota bacterium]